MSCYLWFVEFSICKVLRGYLIDLSNPPFFLAGIGFVPFASLHLLGFLRFCACWIPHEVWGYLKWIIWIQSSRNCISAWPESVCATIESNLSCLTCDSCDWDLGVELTRIERFRRRIFLLLVCELGFLYLFDLVFLGGREEEGDELESEEVFDCCFVSPPISPVVCWRCVSYNRRHISVFFHPFCKLIPCCVFLVLILIYLLSLSQIVGFVWTIGYNTAQFPDFARLLSFVKITCWIAIYSDSSSFNSSCSWFDMAQQ